MSNTNSHPNTVTSVSRGKGYLLLAILVACLTPGCAAFSNPALNGIPVRRLPTELLSTPRREGLQTIPLSSLRQQPPEDYHLDSGDVLGIFIAGVFPLTLEDQQLPLPPVNFPSRIDPLGAGLPPSLGYPFRIRKDGTIGLPLVDPIQLRGLTVERAQEKVRRIYLDKGLLQPGREAVLVTLLQPRQIRVLIFRQEVGGFAAGGRGDIASSNVKQGTGHVADLRAYENDVLNALAYTGGLPGLDAFDGIYIFRDGQSNPALTDRLRSRDEDQDETSLAELGIETVHIPTRWPPGQPLPFQPEDVILKSGDVVLIESRSEQVFYTGGLLPAGEQELPRDRDIDVVEAVTLVRGSLLNGAFSGSNLSGILISPGIGNPSPSALTVVRRTPGGGQVPIRVDLNRALKDPRERIIVQAGDLLILQETRSEAIARYVADILNFTAASSNNPTSGIIGVRNVPVR